MPDHIPPRSTGGELEVLLVALQFQRESFVRKLEGLSDEDARRVLVPSGMTLLWLAKHLAFAEQIWLRVRVAGEEIALSNEVEDGDDLAGALAEYQRLWPLLDDIIRTGDLDATVPDPKFGTTPDFNLRWVVVHLIEEIARHAGHADILREQIDGGTGR